MSCRAGGQTLSSDLELDCGSLRPVAMVTDSEHGVCTSWSLGTAEQKVAALRQLWEEVSRAQSVRGR